MYLLLYNHCIQPIAVRLFTYPKSAEPLGFFVFYKDILMITAVFIDGAFFIKRVRHFDKSLAYNAKGMADLAFNMAMNHLTEKSKRKDVHEMYRVFFYDCPPLSKRMHHPITKRAVDWAKSDEAIFRNQLHKELVKKRKFAL